MRWLVERTDSKYQKKKKKNKLPSFEKWNCIFMLSESRGGEQNEERKKKTRRNFDVVLFENCFAAFVWNLLLFTIAQSRHNKCNRSNASVKTQSSIYAGNSRCWWHEPIFLFSFSFYLTLPDFFLSSLVGVLLLDSMQRMRRCRLFVLKSLLFLCVRFFFCFIFLAQPRNVRSKTI